jgi:AhpD family alkylhydroperoxidase
MVNVGAWHYRLVWDLRENGRLSFVKIITSIRNKTLNRNRFISRSQMVDDFERLLEWARLGAAHVRNASACIEKHRQSLKAKGETEERLRELNNWRQSLTLTDREKAALRLCELISLKESKEVSQVVIQASQSYFNSGELVRLTLAVLAVNDWIDLQPNPRTARSGNR